MRDTNQTFRAELRALRDQLLAAIDGGVLGEVEDGLDIYGRLVRRVLQVSARLQAASGLPAQGTWRNATGREMEWLDEDMRTFVDRAWRTGNPEVLQLVSRTLVGLLNSLKDAGAEPTHRQILILCEIFFDRSLIANAQNSSTQRTRNSLLLGLRSYAEYQIMGRSGSQSGDVVPFLKQVIEALISMTRRAIDVEPAAGDEVLIEIQRLRETMSLRGQRYQRSEPTVDSEVQVWSAAYVLGLAAYVLLRHDNGRLTAAQSQLLLRRIARVLDDDPAWPAIIRSLTGRDEFPWSWWETSLWPPEKSGGTLGQFQTFLRQAAVALVAERGEVQLGAAHLDAMEPSEAEYFAQSMREAVSTERLSDLLDLWVQVSGPQLNSALAGIELLQDRYRAMEEEQRASLPIERTKVEVFIEAVEREWLTTTPVRAQPGEIEADESSPVDLFGYNSFAPRDFFTDSEVWADPGDLGESVGRALVRGEVEQSLSALDALPRLPSLDTSFPERVRTALEDLRGLGNTPEVVIVGSWQACEELAGPSWSFTEPGTFHDAAVSLEYADHAPMCLVVDLRRALTVHRWSARSASPGPGHLRSGDRLFVSVEDIDDAGARSLIDGNENLRAIDGAETEEDAVRKLRGFVQVKVFTKVEIALGDSTAGFRVQLPDDDSWV